MTANTAIRAGYHHNLVLQIYHRAPHYFEQVADFRCKIHGSDGLNRLSDRSCDVRCVVAEPVYQVS